MKPGDIVRARDGSVNCGMLFSKPYMNVSIWKCDGLGYDEKAPVVKVRDDMCCLVIAVLDPDVDGDSGAARSARVMLLSPVGSGWSFVYRWRKC